MYPEESITESPLQQANSKHLLDYIRVLQKRKWLVLTVAAIIFLTTALATFSKTPLYTATIQVLVEKNMEKGRLEGLASYITWDPDFKATQFELIRSFNVALRIVNNQHLDTEYKQYFLGSSSHLRGFDSIIQPVISFFSSLFDSTQKQDQGDAQTTSDAGTKSDAEKIAGMIQEALTLTPVPDTKIVEVNYTHEVPKIAQLVANGIVRAYIEETLDIKTSTTTHSLNWMTIKADEERKKLEDSERALQKYMRKNDIVTVENKLAVLPERLSQFSSELSVAQTEEKKHAFTAGCKVLYCLPGWIS